MVSEGPILKLAISGYFWVWDHECAIKCGCSPSEGHTASVVPVPMVESLTTAENPLHRQLRCYSRMAFGGFGEGGTGRGAAPKGRWDCLRPHPGE